MREKNKLIGLLKKCMPTKRERKELKQMFQQVATDDIAEENLWKMGYGLCPGFHRYFIFDLEKLYEHYEAFEGVLSELPRTFDANNGDMMNFDRIEKLIDSVGNKFIADALVAAAVMLGCGRLIPSQVISTDGSRVLYFQHYGASGEEDAIVSNIKVSHPSCGRK